MGRCACVGIINPRDVSVELLFCTLWHMINILVPRVHLVRFEQSLCFELAHAGVSDMQKSCFFNINDIVWVLKKEDKHCQ